MQVGLSDGHSFRMGGDSLLHRGGQNLDLRGGPLIGWITPGNRRRAQLKVKTRVGAASIQGITLVHR